MFRTIFAINTCVNQQNRDVSLEWVTMRKKSGEKQVKCIVTPNTMYKNANFEKMDKIYELLTQWADKNKIFDHTKLIKTL